MTRNFLLASMAFGAALQWSGAALAQQHIDEPRLSPMLFGETEEERREKIRKEREAEREAVRISEEQDREVRDVDEPRLSPLLFGKRREFEGDQTATVVRRREDSENDGFFSAINTLIPSQTDLSLGVGPVYEPDYFGSDDYEFNADPQIYVKFRNAVFLDNEGVDLAVLGFSRFRIGPTIKIRGRRDQDENDALLGLGDVGTTFEFGGFVATTFLDRFAARARVRHGLKTGHRGTVAQGTLTALLFRSDLFSLGAAGEIIWVGERYADAFYSVTQAQSDRSAQINPNGRLAVFDAGRGFESAGVNVTGYINIADRWSLNPYVKYQRIFENFADTPIIEDFGSADQFTVGFHIQREFAFKWK